MRPVTRIGWVPTPLLPTTLAATGVFSGAVAAVPLWAATFAQEVPGGVEVSSDFPTTVLGLLAAAVTSLAGVCAWLLREFFSGKWVRREQAQEQADTRSALEAATKALVASNELAAGATAREAKYLSMVQQMLDHGISHD